MSRTGRLFSSRRFFLSATALLSMLTGFTIATLLAFSCTGPGGTAGRTAAHAQDSREEAEVGAETLRNIQYSFRQVADIALPVVTEINVVEVIEQERRPFSPFEYFFGPNPRQESPQEREFRRPGLGSGVLVRQDGDTVYVLTNNHVVGDADEISVALHDGRQFKAQLVGSDPRTDLALVSFESQEEVPLADLGDSSDLEVGDWVLAVGNPYGFEATVTAGIVSALGRRAQGAAPVARFTDYIQTDAAINPGNSGGALLNIDGEVVGINTWIASQSGGSVGLGFAVPVSIARRAVNDFIEKGRVVYGWLGVIVGTPDPDTYPELRSDMRLGERTGAFVLNVVQDSPAVQAGLLPGDLITRMDGEDLADQNELTTMIGNLEPGTGVRFQVVRYGREREMSVTLKERGAEEIVQNNANLWPGMVVAGLTDQIRSRLRIPPRVEGAVVYNVVEGSPAGKAGLRQGDVVQKVADRGVGSLMDFYRALNEASGQIRLNLYRQGSEVVIGLRR